jgi:hypothetical protein
VPATPVEVEVKVPVELPLMLNVTIKFSPAWRTLVRMKQGKNSPLAGSGLALGSSASTLGIVNDAPTIY